MFIIGARVPARAAKLKSPSQATTTAREENGGGLQSCLQSSSSVQLAACVQCSVQPVPQCHFNNPVVETLSASCNAMHMQPLYADILALDSYRPRKALGACRLSVVALALLALGSHAVLGRFL